MHCMHSNKKIVDQGDETSCARLVIPYELPRYQSCLDPQSTVKVFLKPCLQLSKTCRGHISVNGSRYCLQLVDDALQLDREQGKSYCQSRGGNLPIADGREDLLTLYTASSGGKVWLDANDLVNISVYTWSSGLPVDPFLWAEYEPNIEHERCTAVMKELNNQALMVDISCDSRDSISTLCAFECN